MHRYIRLIIIACVLMCGVAGQIEGQDDGSWKDLTDEPSRAQLFDKVIEASLAKNAGRQESQHPTSFAIPPTFFFPNDANVDITANKPRSNVVFGVDVSHYDDLDLRFDLLVLQKVGFVYVKATQGTEYKDPKFKDFWANIGSVDANKRPLRGAYHFLSASADGTKQAERFVEFVNLNGGFQKTDLPPCVDLEWDKDKTSKDHWKEKNPDEILSSVVAWLQRTKELTGRTPVVYTSRAWWDDRGIPESKISLLKEYPIWIADYSGSHKANEKPGLIGKQPQMMWQFAEDAKLIAGYKDRSLDATIFYGSQTDFEKQLGVTR